MLYINNPEALVAIEMERRTGLGLHSTGDPQPTSFGVVVVEEGKRRRSGASLFRSRTASAGYAA